MGRKQVGIGLDVFRAYDVSFETVMLLTGKSNTGESSQRESAVK